METVSFTKGSGLSTKDQEREKVVETVSFTKGTGVSTKDQVRKYVVEISGRFFGNSLF